MKIAFNVCELFWGALLLCVSATSALSRSEIPNRCQHSRPAIVLDRIEALYGAPLSLLQAYSFQKNRWVEVSLQIDERNRRGDFVLNEGQPYTARSDDERYDENDELVVRSRDFKDSFSEKDIPANIKSEARVLVRVERVSGRLECGTLLLIWRQGGVTTPLVEESAVSFEASEKIIQSPRYRYSFNAEHPYLVGQLDFIDGEKKRRLTRGSDLIMNFSLPWYLPNFSLTSENFASEVECWQSGPIRTIVAVGVKFRRFLALFNIHLFSELIFYEDGLSVPTLIEFVFDPQKYFEPGTGLAYGLQLDPELKWELSSNLPALPQEEPQVVVDQERRASHFKSFWARGEFGEAALMVEARVDPKAAAMVPPPFLWRRDSDKNKVKSLADHWPWTQQIKGEFAVFLDISGVQKGSYDFGLDLYLVDKASQKDPGTSATIRPRWTSLQFDRDPRNIR